MADTALEVSDLWFWYTDESSPALRGVNLSIPSGQFVALVGANGSGKTTLVKHFNGLLRPKRGSVRIAGADTAGLAIGNLAQQVGFLFQNPEQQIFGSTVRQEVAFGPQNQALASSEIQYRVDAALARFDLTDRASQAPAIMSYGIRRRVTLASLTALDVPILVLDEPMVGLDRISRLETIVWLEEMRCLGRTIVLVTHDMDLATRYPSRVVVLHQGQIVCDRPPGLLFDGTDDLARASLAPPPVVELAQRLRPSGFRGNPLDVDAFTGLYAAQFRQRRQSAPSTLNRGQSQSATLPEDRQARLEDARSIEVPVGQVLPEPPTHRHERLQSAPATLALHIAGDSWLHRLDPRAKLWAVLLGMAVGLLFKHVGVLAGLLVASHVGLLSARIPPQRIRWFWVRLTPLLIMILILQPLFAPGPGPDLLRLGPLRLTSSGILGGVSFALRVAALAFVVAILLLTTEMTGLVQGLVKLGLPYPWGLTIGLSIRHLPTTYSLFSTISEAQQARGWIIGEGNILNRARSYLPILVATVIAVLRLSDQLALALAARGLGYPARRTVLHDLRFRLRDWIAVLVTTLATAAMLYARYGVNFGANPW